MINFYSMYRRLALVGPGMEDEFKFSRTSEEILTEL